MRWRAVADLLGTLDVLVRTKTCADLDELYRKKSQGVQLRKPKVV